MLGNAHEDLCAHGQRILVQEWQKPVRRAAGDQFDAADLAQAAKCFDQVATPALGIVPTRPREALLVQVGSAGELGLMPRASNLALTQVAQIPQVVLEAKLQERVHEHRNERWAERDRYTVLDASLMQ